MKQANQLLKIELLLTKFNFVDVCKLVITHHNTGFKMSYLVQSQPDRVEH